MVLEYAQTWHYDWLLVYILIVNLSNMNDQETKAFELYNQSLESMTVLDMSEHLGVEPAALSDMLCRSEFDKIDELVLKSFKNYWDQSTEEDKLDFLAGN